MKTLEKIDKTIRLGSFARAHRSKFYSKEVLAGAIRSHQVSAHAGKFIEDCQACQEMKKKLELAHA